MKKKILASIIEIVTIFNAMILIVNAAVGWHQEDQGWKYFHEDGQMAYNTGDIINGRIYYFNQEGYMQTGWLHKKLQIRDKKLNIIKTPKSECWYYFDPASGTACIGWKEINGSWYYFAEDGGMMVDTVTPDQKYVNASGVWVPENNSNYNIIGDTINCAAEADTVVSDEVLVHEIVQLVNAERRSAGKQNLQINETLMKAAALRADEIDDTFAHTRPDGNSYMTVFDEVGIEWHSVGENLAYQFSDSSKSVMDGWMKSSGHRVNILNTDFEEIGVATRSDGYTRYWVQLFIN